MEVLNRICGALHARMPAFMKKKVPRERLPFFCIVGFIIAVLASMVGGTLLTALCDWVIGGAS